MGAEQECLNLYVRKTIITRPSIHQSVQVTQPDPTSYSGVHYHNQRLKRRQGHGTKMVIRLSLGSSGTCQRRFPRICIVSIYPVGRFQKLSHDKLRQVFKAARRPTNEVSEVKGWPKRGSTKLQNLPAFCLFCRSAETLRRNILMVSSQNLVKSISVDSVGEGTKSSLIAEENGQKGE